MSLPERELIQQPAAAGQPEERHSDLSSKKGMEFIAMLKKGVEYTQELLKENEKLRSAALQLREQNELLQQKIRLVGQDAETEKVRRKLREQESELALIAERAKALEEENRDFTKRYLEIEEHGNMLANLYIASRQLHSSLNFDEVLRSVIEIIINLVGAERFAVMLMDDASQVLRAVAAEGVELDEIPPVKAGEGVIGAALQSGSAFFHPEDTPAEEDVLVCLPLRINGRALGVIAIYSLLKQKEKLTGLDYELFALLGEQTAMALLSAKLYTESERKLSTLQGFIGLITK